MRPDATRSLLLPLISDEAERIAMALLTHLWLLGGVSACEGSSIYCSVCCTISCSCVSTTTVGGSGLVTKPRMMTRSGTTTWMKPYHCSFSREQTAAVPCTETCEWLPRPRVTQGRQVDPGVIDDLLIWSAVTGTAMASCTSSVTTAGPSRSSDRELKRISGRRVCCATHDAVRRDPLLPPTIRPPLR